MCLSPLKGFQIGYHPSGKPEYKIVSYSVDHVELVNRTWIPALNPIVSRYAEKVVRDWIPVPCHRCEDCLLKHSREWANRCMMEYAFYEPSECWFLTLTYDDEHVHPKFWSHNSDDGANGVFLYTLEPSDLQKFWKRLRIHAERDEECFRKIKYFACGEYGSNTFRPHYHAIVFGIPWIDIQPWERSKSGHVLFRSPVLENIWKKGIVCVSPVTWNTCAYTARYTLKKAGGRDKQFYYDLGLEPEYVVMSRRPGLGRDYYDMHKNHIYEFDEIILEGDKVAMKAKPPKYFDSLYEAENPDAYANIKEVRKECAEQAQFWKMSQTDLSDLDYFRVESAKLHERLKGLYRSTI